MARVLVACEFSGVVRDAFIAAGHDAVSCDLLPSERPGPHLQMDVLDVIGPHQPPERRVSAWQWDLLIAHPPCTYLANSGVRWLYGGKGHVIDPEREALMYDATSFFAAMIEARRGDGSWIPRIAIENPVMHGIARQDIEDRAGEPDHRQTIQPWQFGHGETKATQLWLYNLPPLEPTNIVPGREPRVHHASPGPDRWKERSRTLPGIAAAMAAQWGPLLESQAKAA